MEERRCKPGETIIEEGKDGKELFVVEHGELGCFKVFKG